MRVAGRLLPAASETPLTDLPEQELPGNFFNKNELKYLTIGLFCGIFVPS